MTTINMSSHSYFCHWTPSCGQSRHVYSNTCSSLSHK